MDGIGKRPSASGFPGATSMPPGLPRMKGKKPNILPGRWNWADSNFPYFLGFRN
jgi:hypothetical protein